MAKDGRHRRNLKWGQPASRTIDRASERQGDDIPLEETKTKTEHDGAKEQTANGKAAQKGGHWDEHHELALPTGEPRSLSLSCRRCRARKPIARHWVTTPDNERSAPPSGEQSANALRYAEVIGMTSESAEASMRDLLRRAVRGRSARSALRGADVAERSAAGDVSMRVTKLGAPHASVPEGHSSRPLLTLSGLAR